MTTEEKVPAKNKLAYGLGAGGGCVFTQIAAAYLLQYYTDTVFLDAGAIATMFFLCRILDGATDLAVGGLIDRTSTKWGKARPWLLASAPLTFLGIVLLMNVPMGLTATGRLAYAYGTYIFMNCIVYTIYGISNTALLPRMTRDREEATVLAACSGLGSNILGLLTGISITPLVLRLGWRYASIILGFLSAFLILMLGLMNQEVCDEEEKACEKKSLTAQLPAAVKNRYFWLLLGIGALTLMLNANAIGAQIFYCQIVLRNPMLMPVLVTAGQLPGILLIFLLPVVARRWSKQTFLVISAGFVIAGFAITGLAGTNVSMVIFGTVIRSLGISPLITATVAFVPEVVEYGYRKHGIRCEGLVSAAQSIGAKIGIGVGSGLTGWILSAVHYNPVVKPTAACIRAIRFCFSWVGVLLGFLVLLLVRLFQVEQCYEQYSGGMNYIEVRQRG